MRFSYLSRMMSSLIIIFILVVSFLVVANNNLKDTYAQIALAQTRSIVTKIVNQVVRDNISENQLELDYSSEEYVTYDVGKINNLISTLSNKVVDVLEDINHSDYSFLLDESSSKNYNCSGIIYEMELGKLFNNVFLSSLGSKYPIKFKLVSDVLSSSDLSVEEFGINNAVISLNMLMSFNFNLVLPLTTKLDSIDIKVPLSMMLIEGKVPSFMLGNHNVEGANSYIIEVNEI